LSYAPLRRVIKPTPQRHAAYEERYSIRRSELSQEKIREIWATLILLVQVTLIKTK
jgi:hypothetical protein